MMIEIARSTVPSGGPRGARAVAAGALGGDQQGGLAQPAIAAGTDLPAGGGRSADDDRRICVHEGGHAVVGRLTGQPIGGATVDPRGEVMGLVWGPQHFEAKFGSDDRQALVTQIERLMPEAGEDRAGAADIFLHAFNRLVEVVAGTEAERLFCDGEPWFASRDERDAIAYASLITSSPESAAALIAAARVEAQSLLSKWEHVVWALAEELRGRRTMSGEEIDATISRAVAGKAIADERQRRLDWKRIERAAAAFAGLWQKPVGKLG